MVEQVAPVRRSYSLLNGVGETSFILKGVAYRGMDNFGNRSSRARCNVTEPDLFFGSEGYFHGFSVSREISLPPVPIRTLLSGPA